MIKDNLNRRAKRLWESAKKLGFSNKECQKAVAIYTELLDLVNESSPLFNVCAIFRNRAISHRSLKDYDKALEDLTRELEIVQKRGDQMRVIECNKIIEETREWKCKAEIKASGGDKAKKFQAMEQQAHKLWGTGPDADVAFESLFTDLESDDSDIRTEASRLLADTRNALQKLVSIYHECLISDPYHSSIAGRVLGYKITKGSDDMISADIARTFYGINVSFISCVCSYCSHLNRGIASPPNGPMVPYYSQKNDKGAYAVPVLCDKCSKKFFVVWDTNPI